MQEFHPGTLLVAGLTVLISSPWSGIMKLLSSVSMAFSSHSASTAHCEGAHVIKTLRVCSG